MNGETPDAATLDRREPTEPESGRVRDTRRRLTVLDAMVLVAAAGFALEGARWNQQGAYRPWSIPGMPWAFRFGTVSSPFLVAGAVGLLVLRLRPPRPRLRRLVRQPGTSACLALLLAVVIHYGLNFALPMQLVALGLTRLKLTLIPFSQYWGLYQTIGDVTLIVWLTQATLGAWRPERFWIDRAGRLLGATVIALRFLDHLSGHIR
jgi:hypothetical protein